MQVGKGETRYVAIAGVIRCVALKEVDFVSATVQRAKQAAKKSRMTVAPGRADGKTANDDFHSRELNGVAPIVSTSVYQDAEMAVPVTSAFHPTIILPVLQPQTPSSKRDHKSMTRFRAS
jgi:hypothetical protein